MTPPFTPKLFKPNQPLWNYGVAIVFVLVALLLMLVLDPAIQVASTSFLLFFGALTLSAWYSGRGAGFLATVLSALCADYFLIEPRFSLALPFDGVAKTAIFVLQGGLISLLVGSHRLTQERMARTLHDRKIADLEIQRLNRDLARRAGELQTILDVLPVGVAIAADPSCKTIRVNRFGQTMLRVLPDANVSVTADDAETLPFRLLRNGAEVSAAELPLEMAATHGRLVQDIELQMVRSDGARLDWWVNAVPLFDERGAVRGSVAALVDVTALKQAEQKLQETLMLLNAISDYSVDIVFAKDSAGRLLFVNPVITEIFGKTVEELIGKDEYYFIEDRAAADAIRANDRRIMASGVAEAIEEPIEINGVLRTFVSTKAPLRDANGTVVGIVGIGHDITKRKQTEAALREGEERLKLAIEAGRMVAWEWNPFSNSVITSSNSAEIYGLSQFTAAEQGFALVHPDDRSRHRAVVEQAVTTKSSYRSEFRIIRPDTGAIVWLEERGKALLNEDGSLQKMIGVAIDITVRKQAEIDLRQKNAILDAVNESAPTPIFVKDREGRIIYANPATLRVFGKSADQVIGLRDCEITSPLEDALKVMENDRRIMESGQMEVVEESPDGIRTFLGIKVPYRNETGEVVGLIGISNDITERVQFERDRERILQQEQAAREAAEQANRLKDEFLAVLSHELRTPLNPILGWTKLLRGGKLDAAKTEHALATIERNAELQTQLIEDLLDVSKILQGKLTLEATLVKPEAIAVAALETVRLAAEVKQIQIEADFAPIEGRVWGDGGRLQQVFWNLLSNAVKFTPPGGRVDLVLTQTGSMAQIQVRDSGKGIDPEFLPHVFEHFRQEDSATTRQFGGLGLGLAIACQIVELHGGTIAADSEGEGQGATFTVKLPLRNEGNGKVPSNDFPSGRRKESELPPHFSTPPLLHPSTPPPLTRIRILVVDDETDSREFVAFVLEQAGAEVKTAASGREALDLLPAFAPRLLISDIGMPDMDGYMLMQQIRDLRAEPEGQVATEALLLPAIALTAYAAEFDQQQARQAGFQHHLAKPIQPDVLVREVVKQLGLEP